MMELLLYGTLSLLLLAVALRVLLYPARTKPSCPDEGKGFPDYFPVHCRYFPQMRQVFSPEDADFLAERGSSGLFRRWRRERQQAARLYLASLREDFNRLNRLARYLARSSERLEARQQRQVLWLNLRFQFMFRLALAQILIGLPAGKELRRMTRLLASLGGDLENAALHLKEPSGALAP